MAESRLNRQISMRQIRIDRRRRIIRGAGFPGRSKNEIGRNRLSPISLAAQVVRKVQSNAAGCDIGPHHLPLEPKAVLFHEIGWDGACIHRHGKRDCRTRTVKHVIKINRRRSACQCRFGGDTGRSGTFEPGELKHQRAQVTHALSCENIFSPALDGSPG